MSADAALRLQSSDPPTVHAVIDSAVRPLVRKIDQECLYPEDALRLLGDAGAYGAHAGAPADVGLPAAIADMAVVKS